MAELTAGTGDYTYEVIQRWAKLPPGWPAAEVSAVAVDSKGRVYMFQRSEHPLVVFDPEGNFLTSWGENVITDAHGIFVSPDDHVFLVDRDAHQVLKFTPEGDLLLALGNRGRPSKEAPFNHPADVAVAPSGDIYVSDGYANSRVHRFTAEGKYLGSWGTPGAGPGQFCVPHSIWVDPQSRVYVGDRENNRVQIFSDEGQFIAEWPGFYRPSDIFMDARQAVYVIDHIPRFTVLDLQGNILASGRLGGNAPHGVWGDAKGNLYVAMVPERRLDKYARKVE